MIWFVYNFLLVLFSPLWVPWMLVRAGRRRARPNWRERCGEYSIPKRGKQRRIWVHAVSVGEVVAARPILRELRQMLPDYEIVMSCTTATGHSIAKQMVTALVDHLFYFPLDVPRFCVTAMMRVEPAAVAIMETELWMNFLSAAKLVGAKTCMVNGRISERSFKLAKLFRFFYRRLLDKVDACFMQTEADADRIRRLGGRNVSVLGNSKYDEADAEGAEVDWERLLSMSDDDSLIVVGSARGEEEENLILEALQGIDARILFAPRHIERAEDIAAKAVALGFETGRRSAGANRAQVVILDTFGELASAYSEADIAIVGGGFADLGGQNIIQPLAVGCPVICGPHMRNFQQPFEAAVEAGALRVAATSDELRHQVDLLLKDKGLRERMASAGRELVRRSRGAARRYAEAVASLAVNTEAHSGLPEAALGRERSRKA